MKNINILKKLTHGMYVLTTHGGGCMVDAVAQVSGGDNPLIAVSVNKNNYTNELLKKNKSFALSIVGLDTNPEIIKTFGFNSMRNINKFEFVDTTNIDGERVINDSLGYVICDIIDSIDNDTHTLFIGRLREADQFSDEKEMSYNYYQEHKEELMKIKTEKGKTAWICTVCGYIYYGEELPDDFTCPICGVAKSFFEKK